MGVAVNQRKQRQYNQSLVLRAVRRHGRISRVDLSRQLGLKKSSISNIVNELIDSGLLHVTGQGEASSGGGRKPVFLELNRDFLCFLGIEVRPTRYRAALINLGGEILMDFSNKIRTDYEDFSDTIAGIYHDLQPVLSNIDIPLEGVCLGVPGHVDPFQGHVFKSIPLNLENYSVSRYENPWGVPTFIENDANCCAWGELAWNEEHRPHHFLTVLIKPMENSVQTNQSVGLSTGFGLVINDSVYYGSQFSSGDLKSFRWRNGNPYQMGISRDRMEQIDCDQDVYADYLTELLENMTPITSVFSPDKIVFCGEGAQKFRIIQDILAKRLGETYLDNAMKQGVLSTSQFGPNSVAVGAAGFLLNNLFEYRTISVVNNLEDLTWSRLIEKRES